MSSTERIFKHIGRVHDSRNILVGMARRDEDNQIVLTLSRDVMTESMSELLDIEDLTFELKISDMGADPRS